MAKLETRLYGSFDTFLSGLHHEILNGSISASYEDGADYVDASGCRVAVRVYERYSWFGGNRVSLSVTLTGSGSNLHLTAITSGGSQAMFMKINTVGERTFLDTIRDYVRKSGGQY